MVIIFSLAAAAQQDKPVTVSMADIDWSEDSTEIVTIKDIIKMQQRQTNRNATESHFEKVWGRKGYFNISFSNTKLIPQQTIETGFPSLNGGHVPEMKSNWGLSLQYGRSYRLHKIPIANMVNFNIDYTGLDLSVNHFKAAGSGKLYDSNTKWDSDNYFYIPWNLEKYEVNYAMSIGPSVTVAPFNLTNVSQLHFLKLNLYLHPGWHVSMLYMPNSEESDANTGTARTEKENRETMSDNLKMMWNHNFCFSWGLNLSWKTIGIGYEHRSRTVKYKSASSSDFGKEKYEFKVPDNRVYIQFRM